MGTIKWRRNIFGNCNCNPSRHVHIEIISKNKTNWTAYFDFDGMIQIGSVNLYDIAIGTGPHRTLRECKAAVQEMLLMPIVPFGIIEADEGGK
jgi:hypothetical protein